MRKFLTLAALVLAAVISVTAQSRQYDYDSGHKYGLFSNLEIGAAGAYSIGLNEAHHQNFGAELLVTKRIGDYWRLRGVAEVNGLVKNGFDRYAKGMFGVSFDLLPFYLFADYGAAYNPSAASSFGLAMDGGIGLQFKVGGGSLYTEAAVDRVNSGTLWQSNASVRLGYLAHLGITERDRVNVDIDRNIRTTYGELKTENQLLKSEAQKITQANEQLQSTLERATLLCEQLEKKLTDCNEATRQAEQNCQNAWPSIYFEYASSFLTTIEEEKVAMIAEAINADRSDNVYMIEGYCSANGDPYRNQKLSEERAQAVFFALVANGVDSTRLFMVGNGMSDRDSALEQRVIVKKSF